MGNLNGKVIIITGGSKGQGASEVKMATELGAKVVITDVLDDQGKLLAEETGNTYKRLDVTSAEQWENVIGSTVEEFGKIDGLVNNAGIFAHGGVLDGSLEQFKAIVEVNQVGTFLGMSAVAPVMCDQMSGSIVNISSIAGMRGYGAIAYAASKWAVRGMTKVAANELGGFNIRVNSIHPGAIETDMLYDLGDTTVKRLVSSVPMKRSGTPDEVGATVMFLLSNEASYVSGAEIVVDGALIA
jgi:3alpha(or 20beta)-hydroxysteroid dehydrogenase